MFAKMIKYLSLALIALLSYGIIYQQVSETRDRASYPMPGQLISAGDIDLHMHCTGPATGQPTVLLISGMGISSASWEPVQSGLSVHRRVCSFDRDGLGWSPDSQQPRHAGLVVKRLEQLTKNAGIDGPLVLVGHSYGGLIARVFADQHPERVAGLVMVDSAHEDMGQRFPEEIQDGFKAMLSSYAIMEMAHYTGLIRATGLLSANIEGLTGPAYKAAMAHLNSISHMAGSDQEAQGWETSATLAREVEGFGDTPLYVLVAMNWPEVMKPSWKEMQTELSQLSSVSQLEIIEEATHSAIMMDTRYSPRVINAIEWVLDQTESKLMN